MSDNTDWNSNLGGGFGEHQRADEFFHGWGPEGDSLTETWYWNFHVPEAAINCFAYCWVHPNLKVVTSGLLVFRGHKHQHLECEVFDMYDYMSSSIIGDGSRFTLPNSMQIDVLEPLEHIRFRFDDAARHSRFDIDLRAVDVPIMRANNQHFEQLMHATGDLVLRGEQYKVDCYAVRDRSWGEHRPEQHVSSPPYTWVTGSFGPDFTFNVGAHDDPSLNPDWIERFDEPERIFKDGWVVVNGEQRRVVDARKITQREFPRCQPVSHEYEFTDSSGEHYVLSGKIIAQAPWSGWSNMVCHIGLVEWSWNGRIGYGETQEVQWNEYIWRMNNT